MLKFAYALLSLLSFLCTIYALPNSISGIQCPFECECDQLPSSNINTSSTNGLSPFYSIYCHNGGINDVKLSYILSRLPTNQIRTLSIQSPAGRQPNVFRWNDNFNKLKNLKQLKLNNCQLPAMSRTMSLPNLEVLDLSFNKIEHATISNFGGLPKLRHLDLSNNQLSILPTGVFTHLPMLTSLSLAYNNITELSSNLLRGLRNLKALRLDGNHISVQQMNQLFGDVPNLRELQINNCNLRRQISDLALFRLSGLEQLGLFGNGLKEMPSEQINSLPRLTTLNLGGNEIHEVGQCSFCGNNISHLTLSHNLLGTVKRPFSPEAFTKCNLIYLDISFNHLNVFNSTWLGHAEELLEELDISGNYVEGFEYHTTASLMSLKKLHLAYNGLLSIPTKYPPIFRQIASLNISGNSLTQLPFSIIQELPNLKELDISHNQFTTLHQEIIDYIDEQEKVYLHGNPWDCTCSIKRIQSHMKNRFYLRHVLHYQQVQCMQPKLVRGQAVLQVEGINDCAIILGASYDLAQSSELIILLAGIFITAITLTVLLFCLYYLRERQYKGSYVTREYSQTPLTTDHLTSSSPSSCMISLPTDPPLPPPPAKLCDISYFGI
ncbi:unnamed protein product [Auanema sp. JU1783]|nr:unnamed protein product [Auanema sp. JU1783]